VEAGWTDSSRVERVPLMAAPAVLFAGRPTTERTAKAGAGWAEAFFLLKLAIQNYGGFAWVNREDTHPPIWHTSPNIMTQFDFENPNRAGSI
jgi:hypothetical protein